MSDIEIVFDHKWEAAGGGLALGEDHEVCPDGEWVRYARRLTGIKDLFVYRHKREGSWVLCKWLYPPSQTDSPIALELATMPLPPDMPGSGRLVGDALKRRLRPAEEMLEEMRRSAREAKQAKAYERDQKEYSRKNAVRYMKSHGLDESAQALESGEMPWGSTGEGSALAETATELVNLAKRGN